jgi:hypothetical protein
MTSDQQALLDVSQRIFHHSLFVWHAPAPCVDILGMRWITQAFFDDVLDASVAELNFKAIVDGLGNVLFQYPFRLASSQAGQQAGTALLLHKSLAASSCSGPRVHCYADCSSQADPAMTLFAQCHVIWPVWACHSAPQQVSPACLSLCVSVVFRVPAYYALILRSLTVLEGLALQADPKYKLLGRAYPYIAKRLLTDPAPELRASFEDLILKVRSNLDGASRVGLRLASSTGSMFLQHSKESGACSCAAA